MRFDGDFISPAIVIFPLFYNTLYKQQMSSFQPHPPLQPQPPLQCFIVCYAEAGDEDDEVFIEDLNDDDYDDHDAIRTVYEIKWKKW